MFRDRNRRVAVRENLTQTTPLLKKKQLGQKKKPIQKEQPREDMDDENDQSNIQEERMMNQARLQAWQKYEQISQKTLHKQDRIIRNHLLTVLLFDIQPGFNFKLRTVQHALKMLDLYESKRDQTKITKASKVIFKKDRLYPSQQGWLMVDFITCLFIAAKYNEIYPPSIYDLIDFVHPPCRSEVILKNEFIIFDVLGLNMNVALPSDWYKLTKKAMMPDWIHLCYLDYDLKDKSKLIMQEVNTFIDKFLKSNKEVRYIQLSRLHQKSKNKDSKLSKEEAFKLYHAFIQFRLDRKVGKLSLQQETKENDSKSSRTITIKSRQNYLDHTI